MSNEFEPDYVESEHILSDPDDEVTSDDFVDPEEFETLTLDLDSDVELDSPGEHVSFDDYPDYFQESEQE